MLLSLWLFTEKRYSEARIVKLKQIKETFTQIEMYLKRVEFVIWTRSAAFIFASIDSIVFPKQDYQSVTWKSKEEVKS